MNKSEISALVRKAQAGDRAAFEELYNEFFDKVFFFAKRNAGSEQAAEDITSETFAAALEQIGELRSEESFVGWLYSIAYNKCVIHFRQEAKTEHFDTDREMEQALADALLNEPLMLPEDYAVNRDTKEKLKAIIDGLPPKLRSTVILYYYDDMSVSEVSKALGTGENNTRQRLHKARSVIRKKIEKLIGSGSLFAAVPISALLQNTADASYAAVGTAKVAGTSLAVKLIGIGAAVTVAVGVPIGLSKLGDSMGDYRPNEIQVEGYANVVEVSRAWDGYEDLQGKQFGNVFTLPEKIRPVRADEAYSFFTETDHNEDQQANSEKYFKLLFGDDYDENYISDQGEAKIYSDGDNGKYYAMYLYGPGTMVMNGIRPLSSIDSGYELKTRYDPESDKDTVLEVGNESITVGKLCENAVGFCTAKFDGHFNEFELYPVVLLYYHDPDHDYYSASVTIGLKYKGIPVEYQFTPLFLDENRSFYDVTTHYCPMMFTLDMYGSDDFRVLMVYCTDSKPVTENIDSILSLKEAVSILERELAQNSKYKFERVELLYSAKNKSINAYREPWMTDEDLSRANESAAADYGEIQPYTYVPTWVFTFTVNTVNGAMENYIKVNAVTGEITVDK